MLSNSGWFFIFITRSLPQHNTVSIAIYTSRRVTALFWHRHVQPTKIQIKYTYIRYFRYRVFSWFQIASSKYFIRAFAILMASFYVFNVEYLKKLEGTLIFIQKFFLRISDKQKSPSKVLRLISSIKTRDCGL